LVMVVVPELFLYLPLLRFDVARLRLPLLDHSPEWHADPSLNSIYIYIHINTQQRGDDWIHEA